jgi:hypothetical protein
MHVVYCDEVMELLRESLDNNDVVHRYGVEVVVGTRPASARALASADMPGLRE